MDTTLTFKEAVKGIPSDSIGAVITDCRYRIATNEDDRAYVRKQNTIIAMCQAELDKREAEEEPKEKHLDISKVVDVLKEEAAVTESKETSVYLNLIAEQLQDKESPFYK